MSAKFSDAHAIIQFARTFLRERTESLQGDAKVCTVGATAVFPALLYAFATIDLLGALLGGDAKRPKGMTERAKAYMRRFMHYSDDQCDLLMDVFRHKLVHLAQPNPVAIFKNVKTTWLCAQDDPQHHLTLIPLAPPVQVASAAGIAFTAEQRFGVSIRHFVSDIVDSVHGPGGYVHSLSTDADLQDRFAKAVGDIYES